MRSVGMTIFNTLEMRREAGCTTEELFAFGGWLEEGFFVIGGVGVVIVGHGG